MNRIFRIVWSRALQAWVVASELATRRGKGGMRAVAAVLALSLPAHAADRYWDANGTAVGSGGNGTWNTTGLFWSPNADGVSGPYGAWNNAAIDNAIFGGTAGTVTLGGPVTVHNLTFNAHGYVLTGNTLTLAGATPTILINSGAATIGSSLAGTAGLTKTGAGHLHLTGSNTFSGGINLLGGRLAVYSDAALGNAANGITMANGTELYGAGTALAGSRVVTINGTVSLLGPGVGSARFTGSGGISVVGDATLSNDANDYTGATQFGGVVTYGFTSIADLGVASALGAPTTVATGTIGVGVTGTARYLGSGHTSNRNWSLAGGATLANAGTGTLNLTGDIAMACCGAVNTLAQTADLGLLGVISGTNGVNYGGSAGRTITLGGANTYLGDTGINAVTVRAGELADAGTASSLGGGARVTITGNGVLAYTGAGDGSDRVLTIDNGTLRNDGTGALALSGNTAITNAFTLGGSFAGAPNVHSGVISGTGTVVHNGAGTWWLYGPNTYAGGTTVSSGTLGAGSAQAFGTGGFVVNGGTLAFNDFDITGTTLAGTGGTVALGSGTLTLDAASGTGSYAGSLTGTGGLTKRGASTQVLAGSNTYTGDTTLQGGTLRLDFSAAGGPTSNIVSAASTLVLGGGTLAVVGENGVANAQSFNGVDVIAGSNTVGATSGTGGSTTVNLGAITHNGGLVNFLLPTNGNLTTTNTTLGGWATVNGTDYAKVVGGNITAFTAADYVNKDNAATWLNNEIITDTNGFFGTVGSSVQLGGLRYTRPVSTTVTVAAGQTLGVDGTILVAPTVSTTNQLVTGGQVTGTAGGGVLGVQQNSAGNFTIASRIVDNGGAIGFTKSGTGLVTLDNATSDYTGATIVGQGVLAVSSIADGGAASAIGASSAASSNLLLQGSTLRYTGGTTSSDRGFTLAQSGAVQAGTIEVANATANLAFGGQVTSSDGAGLTKTGPGTLTLGNAGNDYTGVTTVNGGTLSINTLANGGMASGIGAAGSASSNLVLNGGELEYTGATSGTDRGMTLGASGGAIDVTSAASTLTVGGTLVGTGGLTKRGDGTLLLSGNNTFSGGVSIGAGTLRVGSSTALGAAGLTSLASTGNATLDLNGFNTTIGPLSGGSAAGGNILLGSGRLTINVGNCAGNGSCGTYDGTISGTGGVTVTGGGGSQAMTGCRNTYTGSTIIGSATNLVVDCLASGGLASGIGASSSASANLLFNGGQLTYTGGSVSIDRGFQTLSGAVINVANAGTALGFGGQVAGGGTFTKQGAGTLLLSGNNTYTGTTTVAAGILRMGSTTAVNGTVLSMAAPGTFDLNGFNTSIYGLDGTSGTVALNGGAVLTFNEGGNLAFGGTITGTGGLVKNGGSAQQLTGCNSTYTGATVINAGSLVVACLRDGGVNSSIGASSAAAGNLAINGGQLLYVGTGDSSNRLMTLGTASPTLNASGTGAINFTSTAPIVLTGTNAARTLVLNGTNTGNNTLAGQLGNNGTGVTALTKTGAGTWVLTNNNSTYTGVTSILGGVLVVDYMANGGLASAMGASSSAASNLVIGNGATLRYIGTGNSTDRLFTLAPGVTFIESSGTGAIDFTNTAPVTYTGLGQARTIALGGTNTGLNTMGGTITDAGAGVTTLAKNDSGTWVLTGNNTYSGNTVINDGNLIIGNGGTTGNAGTGNVIIDSATSTLSLNRSDTFLFSGTLSGPGTLAQIGTGTSILTAANNSVGATTIDAGTLEVDGGLTTPTIAINGTSTLNVDGIVQGPGATPIALLAGDGGSSTINVNAGGILRANGDLGDGNDQVRVAGMLDTGASPLVLGLGDDNLTLFDGGTITGAVDGGGAGNDTLVVNNALSRTLDGMTVFGFDTLLKQNTGVLALTGNHIFGSGTTIAAGTLDVDGALTTPTVAMGDATTLVVDGTVEAAGGTAATLTGSTGANTLVVNAGGTLRANGSLGDGADTFTLAGVFDSGAGVLDLGAGVDTLTLRDGASIAGAGVSGGTGTSDVLVLDNALALAFDASQTTSFEQLLKQNTGTATLSGAQAFAGGASITGGTLEVDGALTLPTVAMGDDTALVVDGSLQGPAAGSVAITGSTGANTVVVNGTAFANGDLGDGDDVLDVAGLLDTGTGAFDLGSGDDTLTIHEGTNIVGTVIAGAGTDAFDTHIDTSAALGAVQGFETLRKTGAGVLDVNGPASSDFVNVEVLAGTLHVTSGGSITAAPGNTLDTIVANGATLQVDGLYGCGDGDDTLDVAGTVGGTGTIDLCGGDDVLTLRDGAVLANRIEGGTDSAGDALVLDNAGALAFSGDDTTGFETLRKDNAGTATMTGLGAFLGGTQVTGGVLDIDGVLLTPTVTLADDTTLHVDGALVGGLAPATVTGSAGTNTFSVGAAGTAQATGDLGDGDDVLDVAGLLDTVGGVFSLGAGDDRFVVHDGTVVTGTVDGGDGMDTRVYDIDTTADVGALLNFEGLTKTGVGTLNLTGPGTTGLAVVEVLGGTLHVGAASTIVDVNQATVASGATLDIDGGFAFTANADTFTVAGTVSGPGPVDMLDGDDLLVLQDGANLAGLDSAVDGGLGVDTLLADIASEAVLNGVVDFEVLTKTNIGTLNVDGPAGSDFDVVNVLGGTLDIGVAGSITDVGTSTVATGATLHVDGNFAGTTGDDTMDVSGTVSGTGAIGLGDGDDVLTLHDGALLANTVDGGAHTGADTVVLDSAVALAFDGGNTVAFEQLVKTGAGTATMSGNATFTAGSVVDGGVLDIDGLLTTPVVGLADDTVLQVDGFLQGGPVSPATILGSAGVNTVTIGIGATALATGDLGDGNDVLDVAGVLDTVGGVFSLGAGDDRFVVHDGTFVLGTVDGGDGLDSRVYDINAEANVGALVNFEGLAKTGTGTLHLDGPDATDLMDVEVLAGTLDVGPGASVVATAGRTLDTVIAAGATLHVDGAFGCGDLDDTMRVAGTVAGSGTIDLCGGDDVLTLEDGAVLANLVDGGAHGAGDTVVLESVAGMTFDAAQTIRFEMLRKEGVGTATLVGSGLFTGGTALTGGVLQVAGALETPTVALGDDTTLVVDGSVQGLTGSAATLSGSAGANTVVVNGVALANGNLGDGNDVLDVAGTLDMGAGSFDLGAGDDRLTIHDGTNIAGTVVAGAGTDTFDTHIDGSADLGAVQGFETLRKTGAGTLDVNGPASSDFVNVEVLAGTLHVGSGGSIQAAAGNALDARVASGATLQVDGSFGCGDANDTLDVAGTVAGTGTIDLCGGDDVLTLHDGAVLASVVSGGTHGPGDTVVLDVATTLAFDAARTLHFESLRKDNAGIATLTGDATFVAGTTLDGGVLDVDGVLATPTIALGDDTTLHVGGTVQSGASTATTLTGSTGTNTVTVGASGTLIANADLGAGDDSFSAQGTVTGALAFGAGNDAATFVDANIRGLAALDGGDGGDDHLVFDDMRLDAADVPALSGWEQGTLRNGSALQLGGTLVLGHQSNPEASVLVIDPTSRLVVGDGARLFASVANAGTIDAGMHRLVVEGDYDADGGALLATVSPANGTSGGLEVAGDLRGTTAVAFTGDGTDAPPGTSAILVISSPNDDLATPADFTTDGIVRLTGSALPWTLGQAADRNWYLNAEAEVLLPEIGGYAILPSIGRVALLENNRVLSQRMSAMRDDTPRCGTEPEEERSAYWRLTGDCHGVWMAAHASEVEVGADPGFGFSGDTLGLFLGTDVLLQDRGTRTLRAGVVLGFQRGNYWTTGANSTAQQGLAESNVRTDTPSLGFYQSIDWRSGTYLDMSLVAHLPEATIAVADGFQDEVPGSRLILSGRVGHRFATAGGWQLEPQLQLDAIGMHWGGNDAVEGGGPGVFMDDDVFGSARVALRAGKAFETAGGASLRPWITLGVQDTFGEKRDALEVVPGDGIPGQAFPNHALDLAATLDVGVEAELNPAVSLFGVLSLDETLDGTEAEQRQANIGIRVRW